MTICSIILLFIMFQKHLFFSNSCQVIFLYTLRNERALKKNLIYSGRSQRIVGKKHRKNYNQDWIVNFINEEQVYLHLFKIIRSSQIRPIGNGFVSLVLSKIQFNSGRIAAVLVDLVCDG